MNGYFDSMRRYFTFSGRSTRQQYWMYFISLVVLLLIGMALDEAFPASTKADLCLSIIWTVHIFPSLALTVRRLHDADKSGWLTLLLIIPVINLVAFIVFGFIASTPGANRFGPPVGAEGSQQPIAGPTAQNFDQGASTVERLEKLAALRASGAIDQGEFERLKAAALKGTV